jgi:uncharacterized membrane protein
MTIESDGQDIRVSDVVALVLVGAAFAISVIAYDAAPAEVVVHYTPPGGVYYGPETLPKAIGLFIVPVVTALVFTVLRALPLIDDLSEQLAPVRAYYQFGVVLLVAVLVGVQVLLVVLNVL